MSGNNDKFGGRTADFQKKQGQTVLDKNGRPIRSGQYTYNPSKGNVKIPAVISEKMTAIQLGQHKKMVLRKLNAYGQEEMCISSVFTAISGWLVLSSAMEGEMPFVPWMLVLCASGYGMFKATLKQKQGKRMLKSFNIIGQLGTAPQISVSKISELSFEKPKAVMEDLDEMIGMGFLKGAFLDRANGTLVLDNVQEYMEHYKSPQGSAVASKVKKEAEITKDDHGILQEIRDINLQIENRKLSAQIDHIGMITGKILEFQESNKSNERELHSFLSYYLPTTLKILKSYSQLESQNIEGENISKAKGQIEEMMDKIVEGFEKQLDQLFQSDTMDIAADIHVLEQMFEKDGLSGNVLKLNTDFTQNDKKGTNSFDIKLKL